MAGRNAALAADLSVMRTKIIIEVDGAKCSTSHGFVKELERVVASGADGARNFVSMRNMFLRPGLPVADRFVLRWKNSRVSRIRFEYPQSIRECEQALALCHPSDREAVDGFFQRAKAHTGPTVFEMLVTFFGRFRPQSEGDGGLELVLE